MFFLVQNINSIIVSLLLAGGFSKSLVISLPRSLCIYALYTSLCFKNILGT